jgi:hypothetical protein
VLELNERWLGEIAVGTVGSKMELVVSDERKRRGGRCDGVAAWWVLDDRCEWANERRWVGGSAMAMRLGWRHARRCEGKGV